MTIRGEYWILPGGDLLEASDHGEYNHEDHVIEHIIARITDALDLNFDEWGPDVHAFSGFMNEHVFPERYGDDEGDPWGRLAQELVPVFGSLGTVHEALTALKADEDARMFAINRWEWLRVAGPNAEVPDLSRDTLERLGNGLFDILYEEEGELDEAEAMAVEIRVSTYRGRGAQHRTITIGELLEGGAGSGHAGLEAPPASGVAQTRKLDVAAQHPFYGDHLGDSQQTVSALRLAERLSRTLLRAAP